MNLFNIVKKYAKSKVDFVISKHTNDLEVKVKQIRERLILKYMFPQLLQYLRELIIAKGLDPDMKPNSQVVAELNNRLITRNKRINYWFDQPNWVKESFKNESKHVINKIRDLKIEKSLVADSSVIEKAVNVESKVDVNVESKVDVNVANAIQHNEETKTVKKPVIRQYRKKK